MKYSDIPQLTRSGTYQVNVPLSHIKSAIDDYINDGLQMNPDFQRGHIWTREQQIAFVEFLLRGGKSSKIIYFNCPWWLGNSKANSYNDFVIVDHFIMFYNIALKKMSEKINVQMAKSISLKNVFEQLGYKFSNRISQKEFRLFLNKRSSSGQFDTILCNKLFQVLNIDEKSLIPVDNFIEGFLFFENEILRNAESFRIKLAKEQEIYNKILKQCESYKSEKLNAEGFCKNAKIYGQITDINIKKN